MKILIPILALLLSTVALAEPKPSPPLNLPSKMAITDALKLTAAWANRKRIYETARADAAVFDMEIARICKQYKIDPNQLTVTIGVDPDSGEIQRARPPEPPKPEKAEPSKK